MADKKPNILILWGDDIGWWNISYNNRGPSSVKDLCVISFVYLSLITDPRRMPMN